MPDVPDIAQMTTAVGRQGSPSSGTYGEKADVEQLKRDLPAMEPPATGQDAAPVPEMGGGMPLQQPPAGGLPAGGLPAGLMAPSRRPDEPPGMPLSAPSPLAQTSPEQRIQLWHTWAQDPSRSQEFREFVQLVLDGTIRA